MKCYHCGGDIYRTNNKQRNEQRHRWYRCYECDKTIHTVETYVKPGPAIGSKRTTAAAYGERNAASVLTAEDVLRLRQMSADGMLQKDIAVVFGIRPSYVSRIVNRHAWKHI
jgi:hypothetical protein